VAAALSWAVTVAGILAASAWAVAARRGRDPLGPRPEARFGDTSVPLAAAIAAYAVALFAFPPASSALGLTRPEEIVAFALMNLVFAVALLGPARRAAPAATLPIPRQAVSGVVGGLATFGLAMVVGLLLQSVYVALGAPLPEQEVVRHARESEGPAGVAALAAAAVLAPFSEEVFWRGILLPSLLRFAPARTALLAQALAFGALHVQSGRPETWPLAIPLALVGWLAGWLYLRTASLGAAVLLHAVFNALNLAFLRLA